MKTPKEMKNELNGVIYKVRDIDYDNYNTIDDIEIKYAPSGIRGITFFHYQGKYGFRVKHHKKSNVFSDHHNTVEQNFENAKKFLKEKIDSEKIPIPDVSESIAATTKHMIEANKLASEKAKAEANKPPVKLVFEEIDKENLPLGITKAFSKGKEKLHIGYYATKKGVRKSFGSIQFTLDENLQQAINWYNDELEKNALIEDAIRNKYKDENGHIYRITFPDGKKYIGQTYEIMKGKLYGYLGEYKHHIQLAMNTEKENPCELYKIIQKTKHEDIKIELILVCKLSELDKYEKEYIEKENTIFPNGYNMQTGGKFGYTVHAVSKEKRGNAEKGEKHHQYGKPITEEHKNKVKEKLTGKEIKVFHTDINNNDLPKDVLQYTNPTTKQIIGYTGRRSDGTKMLFGDGKFSMDELKDFAIRYKNGDDTVYEEYCKKGNFSISSPVPCPKYMKYKPKSNSHSEGFEVCFTPLKEYGVVFNKAYTTATYSLDEKRCMAINFLNECWDKYNTLSKIQKP